MSSHRRVVNARNIVSRPAATSGGIARIAYDEKHYVDAQAAIEGIRERMLEGARVAVVRGPSAGPFVIIYQQDVTWRR